MRQKKILVGVSGGVDSSVSLALLKDKGYAVSAAFLRFWDIKGRNNKSLQDARSVCEILDIPLKVVDARADFKKTVIKYFLVEYARGNTPNPCVFCNEKMKFKLLFKTAEKMGIEMVATGHYARQSLEFKIFPLRDKLEAKNLKFKKKYTLLSGKDGVKNEASYKLLEAKDKNKDQSYFLYRLGQKELARIIFPLGEYQKTEVRKLAEKFKLPVFGKSDSQDVCFMADNNLEKFLRNKIELKKGKIIDIAGNVLGEHRGLALYTIGQRKGIEIGGTGPFFVVAKDIKKNSLVVTNDLKHPSLTKKIIKLEDVVWTSGIVPRLPLTSSVKTRYRNPLVCAIIRSDKDQKTCQVEFDIPQKASSPGQSVVFYGENEEILGGGIIK